MADNGSIFALEVFPEGWFASEAQPHGWFDKDQLDAPASALPADFIGTNAITFSQSAALLADTSLSGAATLTFGQSGNLVATGGAANLVGSATLVFGQIATLNAAARAFGSATLVFVQSGDVVANTGGANFVGSATISFDQVGDLKTDSNNEPRQPGASWPAPSGWYKRPKAKPAKEEIEEAAKEVAAIVSRENYRVTPQQLSRMAAALVKRTDLPQVDLSSIRQQVDALQEKLQAAIAAENQRKDIERKAADVVALLSYLMELQAEEDNDFLLLMAA